MTLLATTANGTSKVVNVPPFLGTPTVKVNGSAAAFTLRDETTIILTLLPAKDDAITVDYTPVSSPSAVNPKITYAEFRTKFLAGFVGTATLTDLPGALQVFSNGQRWVPLEPIVNSAQPITLAANTTEQVLASVSLPVNFIGTDDALFIDYIKHSTNSAGSKTVRFYLNGSLVYEDGVTTASTGRAFFKVLFKDLNTAIGQNSFGGPGVGSGYAGSTIFTAAFDASTVNTLQLRGVKSVAGDELTLDGLSIRLEKGKQFP
ncbi:hypothetical protein A7981_05670 [Methylovorus sp. MM2]|uniref:hypothetical protein n=1 Tax=Methylovorus sp. MM2 TaxID=1848038 RepID=UPI0007E1F074|nr:hypothetical protein [Methylovorus sp. MM2]OAM52922.1 hypothetical protein A7981_05670 [Methylovorus sp. MM2]